jgi:hypothetical protein
VEELGAGGASIEAIKEALEKRDESLPTIAIKRHLKQHCDIPAESLHTSILDVATKTPIVAQAEQRERSLRNKEVKEVLTVRAEANNVSVEEFLGKYNISTEAQTGEDVVNAVQSVTYGLFIRAAAITDKELDLYSQDRELYKFPALQIKGLSMLHDMMVTAFSYRDSVSINVAAQTIKREGGRVLFGDEELDPDDEGFQGGVADPLA